MKLNFLIKMFFFLLYDIFKYFYNILKYLFNVNNINIFNFKIYL